MRRSGGTGGGPGGTSSSASSPSTATLLQTYGTITVWVRPSLSRTSYSAPCSTWPAAKFTRLSKHRLVPKAMARSRGL